jgi:hypothetical protein
MYYDEDHALALQLQEQFATEVGLLYNFYIISRTPCVGYVIVSNDTYASMLFSNNRKNIAVHLTK